MAFEQEVRARAISADEVGPGHRERFLELASEPVVRIFGVVAPSGCAAGKSPEEPLWMFHFGLAAWRVGDGGIEGEELFVWRSVEEPDRVRLSVAVDPYAVLALEVRLSRPDAGRRREAWLEAVIGPKELSDLTAEAKRLQEPVTRDVPGFGKLVLDRRVEWYVGRAQWGGAEVTLNLVAEHDAELEAALGFARRMWADQPGWRQRVGAYAVQELLEVKNGGWLSEGEAKLTEAQFLERITLTSITVGPTGSFSFWHDDGDVFWGHSVVVSGTVDGGPDDADIPG